MILNHYMDRITKTLLNDFLKTQEIVNKDESSNFGGVSKSMLKKSRLNFDKLEKCK